MGPSQDAQLLELIGEVQGLLGLEDLHEGVLVALDRAVPSDWVSVNQIGPGSAFEYGVSRPPLPDALRAAFAAHAHEHPLIARFERTGDTRPYRLSDVVSRDEFHALSLYRTFYGVLGIEYQISFIVKVSSTSHVAIALSRTARDYSEAERALLDRARPYLIQIYRNAIAYAALLQQHRLSETAMAERLIDRGLTAGEAAVLARVARGQSNADVAASLEISERTVGKHLQRSYQKLGTRNRSQAAAHAWRISSDQAVRSAPSPH
jgi:DNA-binding CsgD family transcriptional regulator